MAFLFRRSEACPIQVQDRFGPAVHGCNGDFDFTLLFQEGIMIIPLMGMVILTMGPRFRYLLSQPVKAKGGWHHIAKLVSTSDISLIHFR